jgi:hypothetical protein
MLVLTILFTVLCIILIYAFGKDTGERTVYARKHNPPPSEKPQPANTTSSWTNSAVTSGDFVEMN